MKTKSTLNNFFFPTLVVICAGLITTGFATGKTKSPWTHLDRILLSTALALHGSDWMMTKDGIYKKGLQEGNYFLGDHPDKENIDIYFASTAVGMSALSATSSKRQRRALLILWNFMELVSVMHNHSTGVRIEIKI